MTRTENTVAVARFAWRDLKKFTFLFLLCIALGSAYHAVRLGYGDPRDYYADQGTEGPLSMTFAHDGSYVPGEVITSIRPGEVFGWRSTLCLASGVRNTAHVAFIRLAQNGVDELEISRVRRSYGPEDHRCGPAIGLHRVAADTLPGTYEIRRWMTLREETWWPLRGNLQVLRIQVLAALPPVQAAPGP